MAQAVTFQVEGRLRKRSNDVRLGYVTSYLSRSWLDPSVAVAPSTIEGQGLFAARSISEGEVVAIIGGRVVPDDELITIIKHRNGGYSTLAIGEGLNLLQEDDDAARYGNHSCDPNLWLADEVRLIARKTIAAGEELTTDYATMTGFADWSMRCNCASELCRGIVTGVDWRLHLLQARYGDHFSPFLNDRIAAISS